MKVFMYSNQAHRFRSQIDNSYFVERLLVAASIKGLLLYVLINFKSTFQESKHRTTSKTSKKGVKRRNMLVKRQIDQIQAQILWKRHKIFRAVLFSSLFHKYTRQQATKSNLPKCGDGSSIDAEDFENQKLDTPYDGEISNEKLPVESGNSKIGAKRYLNHKKFRKNKVKRISKPEHIMMAKN